MGVGHRLIYAVAFSAVAGAIALLVTAITNPDWMVELITKPYWLVFLLIGFVLAPLLNRYVSLRRK